MKVARASLAEYLCATDTIAFSKFCKNVSEEFYNRGNCPNLSKTLSMLKVILQDHTIAAKFSKMACPERI